MNGAMIVSTMILYFLRTRIQVYGILTDCCVLVLSFTGAFVGQNSQELVPSSKHA